MIGKRSKMPRRAGSHPRFQPAPPALAAQVRHASRALIASLAMLALLALIASATAGALPRLLRLAAGAARSAGAEAAGGGVRFSDVTARAGIHFTHNSGRAGKKYLPETLGPGCAFFDADGDGWADILLVNGRDWPAGKGGPAPAAGRHRSLPALYLNNHDGTFRDATAGSGLDVDRKSVV